MKAIIMAAGIGWRLGEGSPPKSLYEFGGKSLLLRHIEHLSGLGIDDVVVGTGYRRHLLEAEIAGIRGVRSIYNPDFHEGNIVTLWRLAEELECDQEVILMDADVLCDVRPLARLINSDHANCLLLDRDVELDEEPVKVCIKDNLIVDFSKTPDPDLQPDYVGESVGFFKLSVSGAARLRQKIDALVQANERELLYEEAIRRLIREDGSFIHFEDISGLPWTEIDFAADLEHARSNILPRLLSESSHNAV